MNKLKLALKSSKSDLSSLGGSGALAEAASDSSLSRDKNSRSILGNADGTRDGFLFHKSISSFRKDVAGSLKGTMKKIHRDNKAKMSGWKGDRPLLPPPVAPMAPGPKLRKAQTSTISLGRNKKKFMTLEELYLEALYTILHMIGCDAERDEQQKLISHLQEAFHFSDERHKVLLNNASMREEPYLKVNVEIIEARDLIGKDMSGSSDPFCMVYLTSNPSSWFNTNCKIKTLNPKWNEDFVLDVNSIEGDTIRIDVWDFNPEENVSEKIGKMNEIKDGRGFRKFIKEVLHASTGKTSHELLGSVEIHLKDIPSSGMNKWLPLDKVDAKSKRRRGDIHVGLLLSTDRDQDLTSQEHKNLLKMLFTHELQSSPEQPFCWNGSFSREAVTILGQHAVQGKLTGAETALARWLVYAHTHCDLPLDYRVFHPILDQLKFAIHNNLLHQEDEERFIETAEIFVHHCIEFIRKHRHYIGSDTKFLVQLEYILRCLQLISEIVEGRSGSPCLTDQDPDRRLQTFTTAGFIKSNVEDAVAESMEHWYRYIVDTLPKDTSKAFRIKNVISLVQLVISDWDQGCMVCHCLFQETLGIDYLKIAFLLYQREVTDSARELVERTSEKMRVIEFTENAESDYVRDTLEIGTSLFDLYLLLQTLVKIGKDIMGDSWNQMAEVAEFMNNYLWFNKAVARWLNIALFKAMQRVKAAVEKDTLEPVDELVKHSSSAVDIGTVLVQIKTFWKQLDWPDVESCHTFLSKILDDICKTSIFYADYMCQRVEAAQGHRDKLGKFVVTPQLCLAINNIDFVLQFIGPFINDLGIEDVLVKLEALFGEMVANQCRRTLTTLVQNTLENVENKILEILDTIGEKMAPVIQKFLVEGTSLMSYAARDKDTLLEYLDNNMIVLKEELNDTNFDRILSVIWECSALSLNETITRSIHLQKPPSYFKTLLEILNVLINFFYGNKMPQDEILLKMKSILQVYTADSTDLIARYFWQRYRDQKSVPGSGEGHLGSVTIRCQMLREHLRVEVMSIAHLRPPDPTALRSGNALSLSRRRFMSTSNLSPSLQDFEWIKSKYQDLKSNLHEASIHFHASRNSGQCDPYVSLRLIPEFKFQGTAKFKTRAKRRTLFAFIDETFDFLLGRSGSNFLSDTYLLITVKDKGPLGNGLFLGEAFLPLSQVPTTNMDMTLAEQPQIRLPLTRPKDQDSDLIRALESRNFDRIARDFLIKERRKVIM